jgi:hypothetical protein
MISIISSAWDLSKYKNELESLKIVISANESSILKIDHKNYLIII